MNKNHLLVFSFVFIAVLAISFFSPPVTKALLSPAIVLSDFAKDVEEGEKATANDENAQKYQQGAKENENTEGREEGEVNNVNNNIGPDEKNESESKLNQEDENESKESTKNLDEQKSDKGNKESTNVSNKKEKSGNKIINQDEN